MLHLPPGSLDSNATWQQVAARVGIIDLDRCLGRSVLNQIPAGRPDEPVCDRIEEKMTAYHAFRGGLQDVGAEPSAPKPEFILGQELAGFATSAPNKVVRDLRLLRFDVHAWFSGVGPNGSPESVISSQFCGLPYNAAWATFPKFARRGDTASRWQVRRPIDRSSVRKWENYAEFFGLVDEDEGEATASTSPVSGGIKS